VKKKVLMKVFLPLLPAMAALLATTGDSVTVYNIPAGTVHKFSYFSLAPASNLQICALLAAVLAVVALVLALAYVKAGKQWCLKGVFYTACASTCAAACPPLIRGDMIVVPNALFPILMAVLGFLAYTAGKKADKVTVGPRLG
jgi:hypothetical protein